MKRCIFLFVLVGFGYYGKAQYSPYYFYDSLKDNGIETDEHLQNLGKVFMDVYPDRDKTVYDQGVPVAGKGSWVTAKVYLERSLMYYYTKYSLDTNNKVSDWDFRNYRPKVKIPESRNQKTTLGFFVCVLICDGDTVLSWRQA